VVPWVFLVTPGSGGVKNTHDPANPRKKGVVRRMRAVLRRVRQKMLRVDGKRRWNDAVHSGNDAVHSGNDAVHSGNDAVHSGNDETDGGIERWRSPRTPCEVTQTQLDNAICGTSANTNAVGTLDNVFGDPACEELRNKLNELINALRR
jgi:hypothetical protein